MLVFNTLILKIFFLLIKIDNLGGDLNDVSAKTATLVLMPFNKLESESG